uniref:Vacuolar protein sorting-associated protein 13 n=1 Tax=Acrobeloides nanus TaxID=290746 RepID=A0A914DD96_9BILA
MVFETLVADLLNRFLGDFIENLDASQLNIGIFGGDVKLNDLEVKQTALDDLDLPVKLKFGYLKSLVLKIPWKNLYTEPVIASIDGLYLIVVPNQGVVYNEQKAKKNEFDNKQKTLTRLEEARKAKRKPKDPAADTFTEKLVAQVIKNLQVRIGSIHVRFEDKYTNRHRPFVAGATLESLNFETTDENWQTTIHKEAIKIFYKLVLMNNLSVYWNSNAKLISDLTDKAEIMKAMIDAVAKQDSRPENFKYVLEPISIQAKLALNQKPETDGSNWSIPKINLGVDMDKLALQIGRHQYQDVLLFLEALERFNLASRYLKYRPNLQEYRGNYKIWWRFAYQCILEENIHRKKKNWSWEHMKRHRKLVKDYKKAWINKQVEKNISKEDTAIIEEAERLLDVFNLNIARQQADMEIDRRGLTRLEDQQQGWGSWAKSFFGGGGKQQQGKAELPKNPGTQGEIVSRLEQELTPEEKAKLYEAIDYQENTPPTDYPKHFVENKVAARLNSVTLSVEDALNLEFGQLTANLEQRPSAKAIHFKSAIKSLAMTGHGQPMLSMLEPAHDWLSLEVETNPLQGDFDQFVKLLIAPIILKYHAPAVNTAAEVFKPPESVRLNQLTAAAIARYEDIKARSATGLQHAVDMKTKLKVEIRIDPATIIISEGGIYNENKPNLITELGLLTINTTDELSPDAYKNITDEKYIGLMKQAYDKFQVKVSDMHLIFADNLAKCMAARSDKNSPYHVIKPTGLDIGVYKAAIDDLNFPKLRLFGDLPDVVVHISDERFIGLSKLAVSIPLPKPSEEEVQAVDLAATVKSPKLKDQAKMKMIMEAEELDEEAEKRLVVSEGGEQPREEEVDEEKKKLNDQQVQIDMNLRLNQVGIEISHGDKLVLCAYMRRFGYQLQMRTFDLVMNLHLGSLTVEQNQYKSIAKTRDHLYLIDNEYDEGDNLLTMRFVQANKESPFFATEYQSIEQAIDFEFKGLNVTLHQEALMDLKSFGEKISKQLEQVSKQHPEKSQDLADRIDDKIEKVKRKISSSLSVRSFGLGDGAKPTGQPKKKRVGKIDEEVDDNNTKMRLTAKISSLSLILGTTQGSDTKFDIQKIKSTVIMKAKFTQVEASLKNITMIDETPSAYHKDLLTVANAQEKMFQLSFVQYNRNDEQKAKMLASDVDMAVKVRFAQLRFIFLNLWLNRLMSWIGPFQEEAAAAAAQAQALAQQKATEAAQNVKQIIETNPPKIQLDVELSAPAIIVPRRSTADEVLLFDLGKILVNNSFSEPRQKTIIDNMVVSLKDLNFATGVLNRQGSVTAKCEILKPISFTLLVHRNLSFQNHKEIPEIAIDAELPLIDMSLSQQDYATMMQTLSGNLTEGPPPRPGRATTSTTNEVKEETAQAPTESADAGKKVQPITAPEDRPLEMKPISDEKRLIFQFKMDAISAALYSGENGFDTGKGLIHRDEAKLFAAMNLKQIKMSGFMTETGGLEVAISLLSFTMNDERKTGGKVKQLLDKKHSAPNELFVSLKFKQNKDGDKNVDLSSSSFFLILAPEFIGSLAAFFAVPKPPEEEETLDAKPRVTSKQASNAATKAATPSQPQPVGTLSMQCRIREVEVILLEDSLKPETSQALILSFNVMATAENVNDVQQMKGGVQDLQIVSTYFQEEMRHLSSYHVLNKMSINFHGTIDNKTRAQEFDVDLGEILIKVSPSIIRLLSAVSAQMAIKPGSDDGKQARKPVLKEYPRYWEKSQVKEYEYWWFQNVAQEADEDFQLELEVIAPTDHDEKASINLKKFAVTLETGSEDETVPMILLESSFNAVAKDWSGRLNADATFQLQLSYYNETYSVWEPIIEPVLNTNGEWESWQLTMKLCAHSEEETNGSTGQESGTPAIPPKMTVNIEAKELMNITVTKSLMQLTYKLSDEFEKAAKQISPPASHELPGISPYLVLNETGLDVKISNSDSLLANESGAPVDATHGSFVELDIKGWKPQIGLQIAEDRRKAELRLDLLGTQREVSVLRAETRCLRLPKQADSGKQWTMVVDTRIENSRRVVYLKSLVNFVNHTTTPLEIYSQHGTKLDLCGTAKTDGTPLNISIPNLYTDVGELHFRPGNDLYEMSNESISWNNFDKIPRSAVRCDLSSDLSQGIYFNLVTETEDVLGEHGNHVIDKIYTVHIYPPLLFKNLLPFPVAIEHPIQTVLEGGDQIELNVIKGHKIKYFTVYNNDHYSIEMSVKPEQDELEVVTLRAVNDATQEINLGIHWSTSHRQQECSIYAPYWVVNNTGKTLSYLVYGTTRQHEPNQNPILLPLAGANFNKKTKAKLRVDNSNWSDEFPVDVAGSSGRIITKDSNDREYDVTVDIQITRSGLTKVLTFSPFYILQNDSKFEVELREDSDHQWTQAPGATCIGFWPVSKSKRKLLTVRYAGTTAESLLFPFTENFESFVAIPSDHLGMYVQVSVAEYNVVVHLEPFLPGMAPAIIMNATDNVVEFSQKGAASKKKIEAKEMCTFTWSDVTSSTKQLEWTCGEYTGYDSLIRNGYGSFMPKKQKSDRWYYWVSFLSGRQRYLLFTDDLPVMTEAMEAYECERIDLLSEITIKGIGISMVDNLKGIELLYMALSSSDVLWEQKQRHRFRSFSNTQTEILEDAFQTWFKEGSKEEGFKDLDGQLSVDFTTMIVRRKGKKGEVKIRRSFQNGFWFLYRQSLHQKQLHLKINHIQIDNQLPACSFPCTLAVIPPPIGVGSSNVTKPFIELSATMVQSEHTSVLQIKYLHLLIQEFAVRLDQVLINELIGLFVTKAAVAPYTKTAFIKDLELTNAQLCQKAIQTTTAQQHSYYDDLHISPLMIHLSFSQGAAQKGAPKGGGLNIQSEFLNLLLKSVGVTITELQDVVFKLAYFERKFVFYNQQQLQSEIQWHYTHQFIKQLYVLVLGLDIIGNPFGLIRDLSSGVQDLFYKPFEGAVQGPEEFAEGLALGVQSLFSHTVGGAAGAVSRITGTLGKGIAALTLDEEYQRKRQEALNRRPNNFGEGIAQSARGLGQGVFEGVTGVFTKPLEGAQRGGVGGFAKGMGQGLVGVVARPVSGVVDFASGTLNAVKMVAGHEDQTKSLRPPRLVLRDHIIRPYNYEDSIGAKIFSDLDHGKYRGTDHFIGHAFISEKFVLLVSDKRVMLAKRQDILGSWITDWAYTYAEINPPQRREKGISLELKQKKKGLFGIGSTKGKIIEFQDGKTTNKIFERISHAYEENA